MDDQAKEVKLGRQSVGLLEVDDTMYGVRVDRSDEKTVELAKSIKELGLIMAITCVVRDGRIVVVAGHRRYAACEMIGWTVVDVDIRDMSEREVKCVVFAENFHREDLSPMEEAAAMYEAIRDEVATVEEVAETFKRSGNWVKERIAMLDYPEDCRQLLHDGVLAVASIQHLAKVTDDAQRQHLLQHAVSGGINERTARAWLQAWQASVPVAEVVMVEGAPAEYIPLDRQAECPCLVCNKMDEPGRMTNVLICRGCVETIRAVPR